MSKLLVFFLLSAFGVMACDSNDSNTSTEEQAKDEQTSRIKPYVEWCEGLEKAIAETQTCEPMLEAITTYTSKHQKKIEALRVKQQDLPKSDDEALDGALSACFRVVARARATCPDAEPLWNALKTF